MEYLVPVAQVEEVDEASAGRSGVGIPQVAVRRVYIDGLGCLGVLALFDISSCESVTRTLDERKGCPLDTEEGCE